MKISDRYASAVNSSNLGVDEKTRMSDSDTLGAYGLADRALTTGRAGDGTPVKPCPLAVPLERLLCGDNNAVYDIVRMLAEMAHQHSFKLKVKISQVQCKDLARACLAWHRDGTCKACKGRGYALIPGTKTLSDRECPACRGSRKIPFERDIKPEWRELARWIVSEMTRASGYAGPAAMKALAPQLEI